MANVKDMTGKRFGRLVVLEKVAPQIGPTGRKRTAYRCKCDCGNVVVVLRENVVSGRTGSCGCYKHERGVEVNTRHGETRTRLHNLWLSMKARCQNPNNKSYHNYGGRGVTVCDEWSNSYESFRDWALANGYADNLSIDRLNNDMGYSPDNCRWVTFHQQQNNRRNNRVIEFTGKSMTLAEWAREIGVSHKTLHQRFRYGGPWSGS